MCVCVYLLEEFVSFDGQGGDVRLCLCVGVCVLCLCLLGFFCVGLPILFVDFGLRLEGREGCLCVCVSVCLCLEQCL